MTDRFSALLALCRIEWMVTSGALKQMDARCSARRVHRIDSVMARLPRTGSALSSLYEGTPIIDQLAEIGAVDASEYETTLAQIVVDLGLNL
jgi:hypothetical protein